VCKIIVNETELYKHELNLNNKNIDRTILKIIH
jgi:hypothetical protein